MKSDADAQTETDTRSMLQILASYAPPPYLRLLSASAEPTAPVQMPVQAAVLFADISGFTKLTERLCKEGDVGVELLATTLNAYFGHVIDLITEFGGEVVKFAGDGLFALWPAESPADQAFAHSQAATCAELAARCALQLQATLRDVRPVHGIAMLMRIGIGIGAADLQQIGGQAGRWEFGFSGEALTQALWACPKANPGEVMLAPAVAALLVPGARMEPIEERCSRLLGFTGAPLPALPWPALRDPPPLRASMIKSLRACLPAAVLERLDAGQSGWLTDLRRVTVLFVLLPDFETSADAPDAAQAHVRVVQEVIGRYEGSINKLHVDEKGVMLLAVFGLPPLSHPDDALRGVRAALLCRRMIHQRGGRCAIGVGTGNAFCGTVGNDIRREYTVLGDVVNFAARLMSAAATAGEGRPILCDGVSYEVTKSHIDFAEPLTLSLKGKAEPSKVYAPLDEANGRHATAPPELQGNHLVGRPEEKMRIAHRLQAQQHSPGGLLIIEGEAGIGKSCLCGELLAQAQALGIKTLYGSGDDIERTTAYFAWTRVFREIFELPQNGSETDLERARGRLLELVPEQAGQMELLGPVLRLKVPDRRDDGDGWAVAMASLGTAEQRQALLVQILSRLRESESLLLLIENAHWLDSASWALLWRIRREVPQLLMVVVSRPPAAIADSAVLAEYQKLRNAKDAELLSLAPLSIEDTAALLRDRLGAAILPPQLLEFIFEQTNGHPFFAAELAFALRESRALRVDSDGTCRLMQTPNELRAQRFPTSMSGVVLSRIDRLRPPQLLLLKVASVVGRTFAHKIVDGIHPIVDDRPHLYGYLDDLEQHELTARHLEPQLTYSFKHVIIQEVAYNTLTFAQRRRLHLAIAAWYESAENDAAQNAHRLADVSPLLAHHYSQAAEHPHATHDELLKAVEALRLAGEQALRSGAAREAIVLFDRALGLLARLPDVEARHRLELSVRVPHSIGVGVIHGYAAAITEQALLRCLADCQRVGETQDLLPTLFGLWCCNLLRGQVWDARAYAMKLQQQGCADPESDASLAGELVQQVTCYFLGEHDASLRYGESLLRRYQRERHQRLTYLFGVDLEIMALCHQGHALWLLGDDARTLRSYEKAIALAREVGHPYSMGFALYALANYHQSHDNTDEVLRHADALRELAERHGYAHSRLQSDFMRGWVLVKRGDCAAGLSLMQRTIETRRATGAELSLSRLLTILAESQLHCGQPDAALATAEAALAQVTAYGERAFAASALQIQAEVLIRTGSGSFSDLPIDAGPDDLLLRAIDIARCQGAGLPELRAVVSLCRLWAAQGSGAEARGLLVQTLSRHRDNFHPSDRQRAHALLKELT